MVCGVLCIANHRYMSSNVIVFAQPIRMFIGHAHVICDTVTIEAASKHVIDG